MSHNHNHNHESAKRAGVSAPMYVLLIYYENGNVESVVGPFEKAIDEDNSDSASYVANKLSAEQGSYDVLEVIKP